jgi:lipid-A-disaccharide synthase-like uncharacterized protein
MPIVYLEVDVIGGDLPLLYPIRTFGTCITIRCQGKSLMVNHAIFARCHMTI